MVINVYDIIYNANNSDFVNSLPKEKRKWLEEYVNTLEIDSCLCCPCFARSKDEDGPTCICTLGGMQSLDKKGECNAWKKNSKAV